MQKQLIKNIILGMVLSLILTSCATTHHHRYCSTADGPPEVDVDVSKIPDAIPKPEPMSKYGNPPSYVVFGKRYTLLKTSVGYHERGIASWYGTKFNKQRTSSGEPYDMLAMTAANKVLPLPTYAQVTNLQTGKRVVVKINDRGPFHENRIIDLSYAAAKKLGVTAKGTALVEVKAIDPYHPERILEEKTPPTGLGHPLIYLQLGAFGQYDNATHLAQMVKHYTTVSVRIATGYKNDAPIYRVQIGPMANVDNTDELHDMLKQSGLGEPIAVIQ